MSDYRARIERLEKSIHRNRLIVLASDSDGVEVRETVTEMIDKGHGFSKVVAGDDMQDTIRLLDYILFSTKIVARDDATDELKIIGDTSNITPDKYMTQEFRDKAKQRAARSPIAKELDNNNS